VQWLPMNPTIADAIAAQAAHCRMNRAPFMAALVEALAPALGGEGAVAARLRAWPGDLLVDAVTLRVACALNWLVRGGQAPLLAALWPPRPLPEPGFFAVAVQAAMARHEAAILPWLDRTPQTNEVGRSAALMAAHMVVAARTAMPAHVLELGASAGLNMRPDRYAYVLGGVAAGDPASPVRLEPAWEGAPPPLAEVRILSAEGVDLAPNEVADADARERLAAYVWPDHPHRLQRLEAALALAAAYPPGVTQGEGAAWLERMLPALPRDGAVRVVQHSVAFEYFPVEAKARVRALIERLGAEASTAAPLAWIALEHESGHRKEMTLTLRLWPGGESRTLGIADGHVNRLHWLG